MSPLFKGSSKIILLELENDWKYSILIANIEPFTLNITLLLDTLIK